MAIGGVPRLEPRASKESEASELTGSGAGSGKADAEGLKMAKSTDIGWIHHTLGVLSLVAASAAVYNFFFTPFADPTKDAFSKWLGIPAAQNPIALHIPYQSNGGVVYVSERISVPVLASFSGTAYRMGEDGLKIVASPDFDKTMGAPHEASYAGLANISVANGVEVTAGSQIGELRRKPGTEAAELGIVVKNGMGKLVSPAAFPHPPGSDFFRKLHESPAKP